MSALAAFVCVLAAVGSARADTNHTPIAVPLLGTSGKSSPYPSTIQVTPRGGPTQAGSLVIMLHAVTHPCVEDLAVLLVHNDTEKYLLLSNAGSCRALQGADVIFSFGGTMLPDSDPSAAPLPPSLIIKPSNYGTVPTFPAPAPAGPYQTTMPVTTFAGTWDLYVMDTREIDRGVIAAGWSFKYDTDIGRVVNSPVLLPGSGTSGKAATYPIIFDLDDVPAGVKVRDVRLIVGLTHGFPDDIVLLLQAPNGTTVRLMQNAGGTNDLANVELLFDDNAANALPDSTQITAGSYKPTSHGSQLFPVPAPGPVEPYASTLATLNGQDARGEWRLWAFDDFGGDAGAINSAALLMATENAPAFSLDVPTTTAQYVADTPFLHVEGVIASGDSSAHSAWWRTETDDGYYTSGPMTFIPGTSRVIADIPMQKGTNTIQVKVRNTKGTQFAGDTLEVTVNEFVYTLSEGATGGFFDLDVTLGNPTGTAAPVTIDFLPENSAPITHNDSVSKDGQLQLHVDDLTPGDAISTVVHSTNAVPLAVERTMRWDVNGYGGSGGTAIYPNTRWLFAEGSQGYFDTYLLLANDGDSTANVTVKFLIEGAGPLTLPVTVPPHARRTLYAGDVPGAVDRSFGLDITSDVPITAERSMYFPHGGARTFEGGHEAAGTNATSTRWFLAEGATGPFFQTYVLLSNPNATKAVVTLTYLLADGSTVPQSVQVPGTERLTIDIESVAPQLANTPVSTIVDSDLGIIVERSMYWPDFSLGWQEAHNSIGVTTPALRWAVADGRIGGARSDQTYVLLANPNTVPAEVQVRFLQSGQPPVVRSYTLPPTSRTNIAPASDIPELGVGVFSADVQVLNYQPIVVEKALYWNSGATVWAAGTGTVATPIPPPR